MDKLSAVVLAAGYGKRMKSDKPKVLHEILGKPIINYILDAATSASVSDICVVIGHLGEQVKDVIEKDFISFRTQTELLGTGHAVMSAIDFISDSDILVLYGDTPLITADILKMLHNAHVKQNNGVTLLTALVDDPEGYGRIIRNNEGRFLKIVEHSDALGLEKTIKEINTGIYCFKGDVLKNALKLLKKENSQGEFYLTDTIEIIKHMGLGAGTLQASDSSCFYGVNSRSQLAFATSVMKERINENLMELGVTIIDPASTFIGPDVTIGADSVIYPGCFITGSANIGCNTEVGPNSKIHNCTIGDFSSVWSSFLSDSTIGEHTTVGPFAYIRPNCSVGSHCRIGDFVEIKNSNIGNNTKVSHLTYVGDSDVGKRVNFGCGTVTVNYDGKKKHRTIIEDNAFLGCNTNLIAPVTVKKGAYTAAGSTITKNVPEDSLAIARSKQENKIGYKKL